MHVQKAYDCRLLFVKIVFRNNHFADYSCYADGPQSLVSMSLCSYDSLTTCMCVCARARMRERVRTPFCFSCIILIFLSPTRLAFSTSNYTIKDYRWLRQDSTSFLNIKPINKEWNEKNRT